MRYEKKAWISGPFRTFRRDHKNILMKMFHGPFHVASQKNFFRRAEKLYLVKITK